MGQDPILSIEVDLDFESGLRIAKELIEWTNNNVVYSSVEDSHFEFKLEWDESDVRTGDDEDLQALWVSWSTKKEHSRLDSNEFLFIHYSPYYSEDNLKRFVNKAEIMRNILIWLEKNTDCKINHYVATKTV